jgi:DNA polymerase-1
MGKKFHKRPPLLCPKCKGEKAIPDVTKEFTSPRLRKGQVFFPTYHPAWLMHGNQTKFPIVDRHFSRIPNLHKELEEDVTQGEFTFYPSQEEPAPEGVVALDLETTGTDPDSGTITCISASGSANNSVVYKPSDPRVQRLLSRDEIIGQNWLIFDAWWIWKKYRKKFKKLWDTRFAGHLLNPDTPNDLVSLTQEFADPPIRGYWKSKLHYKEEIERVAAIDTMADFRVKQGQHAALARNGQLHVMEDNVIPLMNVLFDMRVGGMKIDRDRMETFAAELDSKINEGRDRLPDWGGKKSEFQSGEIKKYLYRELRLPVIRDRESEQPTTRAAALTELKQRLVERHRSCAHLTERVRGTALSFIEGIENLRKMSKLASTFLRQRLSATDFVHPVLNPGGTTTLRLSCSDPNAQQIPPSARGIFLPDTDEHVIISADLKQAEVVGLLWFAQEWDLLFKVFSGHDIHQEVAKLIFRTENPTKTQRKYAKVTTFALLYGEGPETTAYRLGLSLEKVLELRERYFAALPGVKRYREAMIEHCMTHGFVQSPFNVRRYIRLSSPVGRAANQACNQPIQNLVAMIARYAMIKVHEELPEGARLLMQVHDELVVSAPKDKVKEVAECLIDILGMSRPELPSPKGNVGLTVDLKSGPNWGDQETLKI